MYAFSINLGKTIDNNPEHDRAKGNGGEEDSKCDKQETREIKAVSQKREQKKTRNVENQSHMMRAGKDSNEKNTVFITVLSSHHRCKLHS